MTVTETIFEQYGTDIYGLQVVATPSSERESVLFMALGHGHDERRTAAVVSFIKRTFGYHDLLGRKLDNFVNSGYAVAQVIPPTEDTDGRIDFDVTSDSRVGAAPVTWGEF